ncbi:unnamed protein product [Polarella glacialis]|uniref:Uncharacterized protein n=2 Tax=Polarella glacialis TaxID=89957 RepID=A0A813J3Z7_POLGL|nr:unnamed protein product [Polarella glacialis]
MVREVMAVNNCLWDDAQPLVDEIKTTALSGADVYELPYYTSLVFAFFGGVVCMPLIFHLPTVEWFNARFVTSDVPQDKDLETCFEVGSWSWGWMEPVIGTLSFVLLIAQFSRAQMLNIGVRPYGKRIFDVQVARLQSRYPEYNKNILEDFLIGVKRKMKE